jgi:ubiquitin carboxyl-terminal hydrolase 5/13
LCDKELDPTQQLVSSAATALITANSASKQEDQKAWENQVIQCEHTITLQQAPNLPKLAAKCTLYIVSKTYFIALSRCGECELNTNLWLCLVCGHLGCGRRNYDGTGGNNHAVEHNHSTKHGLVCKMGTITPEGTADIFCYDCDETRLDPFLTDHLANFGIEVASQQKTEMSTAEKVIMV